MTNRDRLEALLTSSLLDSPPEAVFDRAVKLATQVLGTPVGLLSFVDDRRQFFKAQIGLTGQAASDRGTPLSHSFCQYVVAADAPLIVRDARTDPVLSRNLAVPDLGVVAYLGVPVHDGDGHVLGSFCAIDVEPRNWSDYDREILESIRVGVESEIALRAELKKRTAAEDIRAQAEERLQLALRAGQLGSFDFDPRTEIAAWDPGMYELWWIDPQEQDPYPRAVARVHPSDKAEEAAAREAALDPAGTGRHEAEFRIVHPETGEVRWLHLDGKTTFVEGVPVRVVGTARDVTKRRSAELQNALLTKELNHRVKNLFAITLGMINLTARSSETPAEMSTALSGRIQALASAHEIIQPAIVGQPDLADAATLRQLVEAVLRPHGGTNQQVKIDGPDVHLNARPSTSLALVVHELVTNAVKYGALSVDKGVVEVTWSLDRGPEDTLHLVWSEVGAPTGPGADATAGFGTRLIEETVAGQLLGSWSRTWRPVGLLCELSIPMRVLVQ
ncbi:HWE histidine kinase domain-containing protein [Sulfitobacter sp. D35]|uniref:sensor histidine kinase n=1 Tax=Sulfitobacter sp. D35 TaxID=3083252 RepID=UPI00296EB188|nr:HWE histidine kinase domain-containing protein [Sulfitobacter sp. D35]MDW4499753.1 HWE histidine kinase domain-containing protein [Sulfitobacter sp. D35]